MPFVARNAETEERIDITRFDNPRSITSSSTLLSLTAMQHNALAVGLDGGLMVRPAPVTHLCGDTLAYGVNLLEPTDNLMHDLMERSRLARDGLAQTGMVLPPTYSCMQCKGQHSYAIEHFLNGNTGWRCADCGQILRLIPGRGIQ